MALKPTPTARADDNHAAPSHLSYDYTVSNIFKCNLSPVRFLAYHRIKPHVPPLVRPPSIPLSFTVAGVLPGGILNAFAWLLTVYRKQRVFIVYCVDYQGI